MNRELLQALSMWLRAGGETQYSTRLLSFDMSRYFSHFSRHNDCRTQCCIAGATLYFWGSPKQKERLENYANGASFYTAMDIKKDAMGILGLDYATADTLFNPGIDMLNTPTEALGQRLYQLKHITPEWAANVIDYFLLTGNVRWWQNRGYNMPAPTERTQWP